MPKNVSTLLGSFQRLSIRLPASSSRSERSVRAEPSNGKMLSDRSRNVPRVVCCRLPANADTSKIEAKFDNGVLEVKVPKKQEAVKHETKDVEVKHDQS